MGWKRSKRLSDPRHDGRRCQRVSVVVYGLALSMFAGGVACGGNPTPASGPSTGGKRKDAAMRNADAAGISADEAPVDVDATPVSAGAAMMKADAAVMSADPAMKKLDAGMMSADAGMKTTDGGMTSADAAAMSECAAVANSVPYAGACACDTDCMPPARCAAELPDGYPGNACLSLCRQDHDDCPPKTVCGPTLDANSALSGCLPICTRTSDCRWGSRCSGNLCVPSCTADDQCRSHHCNLYRGVCGDGKERARGGLLARCVNHDECKSGWCSTDSGRCLSFCDVEQGHCPEDALCVSLNDPDKNQGICLPSCETRQDCDGLECHTWISTGLKTCTPYRGSSCGDRAARSSTIGGPCGCADDCPEPAQCSDEDSSQVPGGLCRVQCPLPSGKDFGPGDGCGGDGFMCALTQDTFRGACFQKCSAADDCPAGRICSFDEGCKPFCQLDSDCISGVCNPYNGWCDSTPTNTQGAIGASCTTSCRGFCHNGPDGSFCSAWCSLRGQHCPDHAVCMDDGNGDDLGYCSLPSSARE